MVASANSFNKIICPQEGSVTKEIFFLPFHLHSFRKAAITRLLSLLLKNGANFVPHVILHLIIYQLLLQKYGGPDGEGQS